MNHIFRVVRRKSDGLLVVASEMAKNAVGGSSQLTVAALVTMMLCSEAVKAATTDIAVDTTVMVDGSSVATASTTTATVFSSNDSVDVVNIAAPNADAVSHTTFTKFNVGTDNAIINNAKATATSGLIFGTAAISNSDPSTRGDLTANSFINSGGVEAELVIIEVSDVSSIANFTGSLEVVRSEEVTSNSLDADGNAITVTANKTTDLVIAVPGGILIDGARFIGTENIVLASGAVTSVTAKQVELGVSANSVTVSDNSTTSGATSLSATELAIISKEIKIQGKVEADSIVLVATDDTATFDGTDASIASTDTGTVDTAGTYAIDSTALGGMYANRITIIANEVGTGVRVRGDMGALGDAISISADGDLVVGEADAATITLEANSISLASTNGGAINLADTELKAVETSTTGGDITINTTANVAFDTVNMVSGEEATGNTGGDISITAADLTDNTTTDGPYNRSAAGHLAVNLTGKADINNASYSGKTLDVDADELMLGSSATLYAKTTATVDVIAGATIDGALTFDAGSSTITRGNGVAGGGAKSDDITFSATAKINADDLVIDNQFATGKVEFASVATLRAGGDLSILGHTINLDNAASVTGNLVLGNGTTDAITYAANNTSAQLTVGGTLAADATTLAIHGDMAITGAAVFGTSASGPVDQFTLASTAALSGLGALTIDAVTATINGDINRSGNVQIDGATSLSIASGASVVATSAGNVTLAGASLSNAGLVEAAGTLTLGDGSNAELVNTGSLKAAGNVSLDLGTGNALNQVVYTTGNGRNLGRLYDLVNETSATSDTIELLHTVDLDQIGLISSTGGNVVVSAANFVNEGDVSANGGLDVSATNYLQMFAGTWDWANTNSVTSFTDTNLLSGQGKYDYVDQTGTLSYSQDQYLLAGRADYAPTTSATSITLGSGTHANVGGTLSSGTLPSVNTTVQRTTTTNIGEASLDTSNATVGFSGAPVVADGSTNTDVEFASNKATWVVHIAAPNQQGLSNNTYSSFNVNSHGLILNNMPVATSVTAVTDLSAEIVSNPNLTTSAAVILNQVTGTTGSIFNGYIEVAGSEADLIIANPYGITCNDCGVLNVDRMDLVVGSSSITNGVVSGFNTANNGSAATGTLRILGPGLDLSRTSVSAVIAPEIIIDAGFNTHVLYAGIGSGEFSRLAASSTSAGDYYNRTSTTSISTNTSALLMSEQAGVFADDIVIDSHSGSQNPNIRILGEVAANQGNLTIDTDGTVLVQGRLSAAKDVNVTTTSSTNSKNPVGADIQLSNGAITAGEDLLLKADTGSMIFGGGQLYSFDSLTLDSLILIDSSSSNPATFNNSRYAAGTLALNIDDEMSLSGTTWQADTFNITGTNLDVEVASGTKLIADTTLGMDIKSLDNTGTLVSNNQFNLDASSAVTNRSAGIVKAKTASSLTTPTLTNHGTWMASTDTTTAGTAVWKVDNVINKRTGTLSSAQSWTLADTNAGATTNVTNLGTVTSEKELDASLATFTNTGTFTVATQDSGAESVWTVNTFTNNTGATLFAGDDWRVNTSGNRGASITNMGVLQAYRDLDLSFDSLTLGSGKDISGALKGTAGDVFSLNVSNAYSLSTMLYSNADLAANFDSGLTINATGAIVGNGSTSITAAGSGADIVNYGFLYAGQNLSLTANDDIGSFVDVSLASGRYLGVSKVTGATYREQTQVENSRADIRSGGDLTINAGDLFVNSSEVRAAGSIDITAPIVSNQVQRTSLDGFATNHPLTETVGKRLNYTSSTRTVKSYRYPDNYTNYTYTYTWDEFNYFKEGAPAVTPQIIAGTNYDINATTVNNYGGLIQSTDTNGNSDITATTMNNDALALEREDFTWTKTREIHWAALGPAKHSDNITGGHSAPSNGNLVTLDQGAAQVISAGGLSISAGAVTNVGSLVAQDSNTTRVGATALNPNGFSLAVSLPSNPNGFFVTNRDPSAQYLVEMNPKLQPGISTLGSDYLIESLNVDNDSTIKRLGDASYEAYLVEQQLIEATGRSVLEGYNNIADVMKGFMDNAAAQANDMGFTFGKPLTNEQIAGLTEPVVWMVETLVNGETVLAPKVYLPKSMTDELDGKTATIAAKDLDMDVETLDNLGGNIEATENLDITAKGDINNISGSISGNNVSVTSTEGNINNETFNQYAGNDVVGETVIGKTASISAKNDLSLDAAGDITNLGATMDAGGNASLNADGDITFDTIQDVNRSYSMSKSSNGINDTFSDKKTMDLTQIRSGLTVGGDLTSNSGGDTTFAGTNVSVGGDADVEAGGGINIIARENVSTVDTTSRTAGLGVGGGVYGSSMTTTNSTSIRNQGSTFDVGGDASFKAEDDLTIQGSDLNVAGSADIQADSLVVLAGRDVDTFSSKTETTSFLGGDDSKVGESADGSSSDGLTLSQTTIETTERLSQRSQASNLNIGNNLTVNVEQDVLLQGSNVEAGGDVDIDAQNIYMLAAQNIEEETTSVTTIRTGLYASSETDSQGEAGTTTGTETNVGTETQADASGKSASASASAEASAGASAGASASGSASANATLDLLRVQTNTDYKLDITNTGSTIKSGGNLNLNAEEDILLVGSEIEADGDVTVDASSMLFAAAEDVSIREKTSETIRTGLYADSGASGSAEAGANANASASAEASANAELSTDSGARAGAEAKAEAKAKAKAEAEGKAGAGIQVKHAKKVENTTTTTAVTSAIKSNSGSITRTADESIIDIGTNIEAAGDLNQSAETIASFAARNTTTTSTSYEETTAKTGIYVEALGEAEASAGAEASAEGGTESGGAEGEAKAGAKAGAEGRASAGLEMQMERLVESTTERSSEAVVATINVGGDVNTESSGSTIMEGTIVEAGGDINVSAEELELRAARDEYSKESSSERISARVAASIGVGGEAKAEASADSEGKTKAEAEAGGGVKARLEIEADYSKATESEASTTAVTGSLAGSNINITTTKATTIEGADLNAENSINVDAESLGFQAATNTFEASSSSLDISAKLEVEATVIGSGDLEVDMEGSTDIANAQSSGTEAVTGSINASNLNITTKNDVRLEGTEVDVTDSAAIDAGGNIELAAAQNTFQASDSSVSVSAEFSLGEQSASADVGVNSSQEQSTEAVTGSLNIGGNLSLNSGNDIVMEGTDVAVDGDANVNAANDVTMKAARSTSSSSSNSVEVGVGGSMKKQQLKANVGVSSESASANEADAGSFSANNMTITAGNDVTLEGTAMDAQGDATIAAGGSVAFTAAKSTFESSSNSVEVGVGIDAKKGNVSADVGVSNASERGVDAEAGSLNANNLTIVAKDNASFEGTDLAAENDATIVAGGDVAFTAARSTFESDSLDVEVGVGIGKKSASASVGVGVGQERQNIGDAGSISGGNNIAIVSGGDMAFEGTDLEAGNGIAVAAAGDVTFAAVESTSTSTDVNVGIEAGASSKTEKDKESGDSTTTDSANAGFELGIGLANSREQTGSNINAGEGGFTVQSGGDVTLQGTQASTDGAMDISAEGDITQTSTTSESSSFGLELAASVESTTETTTPGEKQAEPEADAGSADKAADAGGDTGSSDEDSQSKDTATASAEAPAADEEEQAPQAGKESAAEDGEGGEGGSEEEGKADEEPAEPEVEEETEIEASGDLEIESDSETTETELEAEEGVTLTEGAVIGIIEGVEVMAQPQVLADGSQRAIIPGALAIPPGTEVVLYDVEGMPLPAWVQFDSTLGAIVAKPPEGFTGILDIVINVPQADGSMAKVGMRVGGE